MRKEKLILKMKPTHIKIVIGLIVTISVAAISIYKFSDYNDRVIEAENFNKKTNELKKFPSYEEIVKEFFSKYSIDKKEEISFAKKSTGWHIEFFEFRESKSVIVRDLIFWSSADKCFKKLNLNKSSGENVSATIKSFMRVKNYLFDVSPYYGYAGWDFDVINLLGKAEILSDTNLYALAKAYSLYASNLINNNSGLSDDTKRYKIMDDSKLTEEQLKTYRQYAHKSIKTFERLKQQNPRFETFVGEVNQAYSNEFLNSFLTIRMYHGEEEAKKELKYNLYDDKYLSFAKNLLNSCNKNAILFTNGDNDTYPLLYVQSQYNYRPDVLVVNLNLTSNSRYINHLRNKIGESEPISLTLKEKQYRQGTRDYVPVYYNPNIIKDSTKYYKLEQLIQFLASEEPQAKIQTQNGMEMSYLPTEKALISVDSAVVVNNGTVPKGMEAQVLKALPWKISKQYILKNDLMIMDIIATNNWKRPIYFAITVSDDAYLYLDPFFQLEGLAYRLVPIRCQTNDGQTGKVNTDIMYNNMMNKFKWGVMNADSVYSDKNYLRIAMNLRNIFARLAEALLAEGKTEQAQKVITLCMKAMPGKNIPYNYTMLPIAEVFYKLGMNNEANQLLKDIANIYEADLKYYFSIKGNLTESVESDKQKALAVFQHMTQIARMNGQEALSNDLDERFNVLQKK
jgi:hypothetical protein